MKLLGIDTGGTFTDLVYTDGKTVKTHKVLSTPHSPEEAIMRGINEMQITLSNDLHVIHGSTVATNAVLEGKGVQTVYITNRGFKDVLSLGRQARKKLYDLSPKPVSPPVAAEYCLETGGRLSAQGDVLEPLTKSDIETLKQETDQLKPKAIAINLLFSYLDSQFEEQIESLFTDDYFVSRSSQILPVYKEYERGMTTWLNAYVGPLMQGYLQRLQHTLEISRLSIMRSSGQTCDAAQAAKEAVHLLLSGPAGGMAASKYLAEETGYNKLLTFDMGGTSTDVAMYDDEIELTGNGQISSYPVGVPMVNIHTIGAGGGSIAFVDEGGALQVGPKSAGAVPGPACYGQGGECATVTDANLVLKRIPESTRFGGAMSVDINAANTAIDKIAQQSCLESNKQAAEGIINIANEHMAQALRVISLERGIDPREFVLAAFGGAGGLHVCELAEKLDISTAIVPAAAGVLSALGMLVAEPGRQLTLTVGKILEDLTDQYVIEFANKLIETGVQQLLAEGHDQQFMIKEVLLECCYEGQGHTLSVAWKNIEQTAVEFEKAYKSRYGNHLQKAVELVNIRVGVRLKQKTSIARLEQVTSIHADETEKVITRTAMVTGKKYLGPMCICDAGATIWLAPSWHAEIIENNHIVLKRTKLKS